MSLPFHHPAAQSGGGGPTEVVLVEPTLPTTTMDSYDDEEQQVQEYQTDTVMTTTHESGSHDDVPAGVVAMKNVVARNNSNSGSSSSSSGNEEEGRHNEEGVRQHQHHNSTGGNEWVAPFGGLVAVLWIPLFVLGTLPARGQHKEDCEALISPVTYFVLLFLCCLMARAFAEMTLQVAWPGVLEDWAPCKQRDAVGDLVKAVGRLAVLALLLPLWSRLSYTNGLDLGASCSIYHSMFNLSRYMVGALMAWELAYNPTMKVHLYVHHLSLLALIVWGVDLTILYNSVEMVGTDCPDCARNVFGYVFLLLQGAVVGPPIKELLILRYRFTDKQDAMSRSRLLFSVGFCHAATQFITTFVLPSTYLVSLVFVHANMDIRLAILGFAIIFFLTCVDVMFVIHTLSVARAVSRNGRRAGRNNTKGGGAIKGDVTTSSRSSKTCTMMLSSSLNHHNPHKDAIAPLEEVPSMDITQADSTVLSPTGSTSMLDSETNKIQQASLHKIIKT